MQWSKRNAVTIKSYKITDTESLLNSFQLEAYNSKYQDAYKNDKLPGFSVSHQQSTPKTNNQVNSPNSSKMKKYLQFFLE